MRLATPDPQPLAIVLQYQNYAKSGCNYTGLNAERFLRALCLSPLNLRQMLVLPILDPMEERSNLEIRDDKASTYSSKVEPRSNFSGRLL